VGFRLIMKGPGATAVQTVCMDFIHGTVKTENWKPTRISGLNLVRSHYLCSHVLNFSRNDIHIRNTHIRLNKHSVQPEVIKVTDYVGMKSSNYTSVEKHLHISEV
jgi:hypothetical protein